MAYVAVALVVDIPWRQVAVDTFILTSWQTDYIVTIVAVLGTTITPYCFFWQSSEEVEQERINANEHTLLEAPQEAPAEIGRIRTDTYIGMGFSNLINWFIIIATAATLHANGIANIETSAQAAEALRPIAGVFTFAVSAAGMIGVGLLAVPVLAGSAAYALGEALGWPNRPRAAATRREWVLRHNCVPKASDRLDCRTSHHEEWMNQIGLALRIGPRMCKFRRAQRLRRTKRTAGFVYVDDRARYRRTVGIVPKKRQLPRQAVGTSEIVSIEPGDKLGRAGRKRDI